MAAAMMVVDGMLVAGAGREGLAGGAGLPARTRNPRRGPARIPSGRSWGGAGSGRQHRGWLPSGGGSGGGRGGSGFGLVRLGRFFATKVGQPILLKPGEANADGDVDGFVVGHPLPVGAQEAADGFGSIGVDDVIEQRVALA